VTLTRVLDNVRRKDTVEVLNSNEGVSDGIVDPDDLRGPFGLDVMTARAESYSRYG